MKILITGGSGYIGKFLAKKLQDDKAVEKIIVIDKREKPDDLSGNKIVFFQKDLSQPGWENLIDSVPDVVIHSAFEIRSRYGKIKQQEDNNLKSCERVFRFCFEKGVRKLIYFSSAAVFGPKKENIGVLLEEGADLMEYVYPYGSQKRMVESQLKEIYRKNIARNTSVAVLRFSTVNGPEGEKRKKIGMLSLIKKGLPVLPVGGKHWARQYLHEEDIYRAINLVIGAENMPKFEIFNLTPNDFLEMPDIAKLLGKTTLVLPVWLVKIAFFFSWHLTLGFVPTCRGAYKSFCYPSNMDGQKICKYGFTYSYNSRDAFWGNK